MDVEVQYPASAAVMSSPHPVSQRPLLLHISNGPHHNSAPASPTTTVSFHRALGLQDYAAYVSLDTLATSSPTIAFLSAEESETTKASAASSSAASTPSFTVTARPFVKVRPYNVCGCVSDVLLPSAFCSVSPPGPEPKTLPASTVQC